RLSLYLCGDRMTQNTFFSVGNGTGPTTVAPARSTVSTTLRAELSMTSWSQDLSRMRIFCPAMASSDSLSSYLIDRPTRSGVSPFATHSAAVVHRGAGPEDDWVEDPPRPAATMAAGPGASCSDCLLLRSEEHT